MTCLDRPLAATVRLHDRKVPADALTTSAPKMQVLTATSLTHELEVAAERADLDVVAPLAAHRALRLPEFIHARATRGET